MALAAALAGPGGPGRAADRDGHAEGADLALTLAADGTLAATGVLPPDLSAEKLAAALPGIDLSDIDTGGPGAAARRQSGTAIEALSIVLPRLRTATARIGDRTLALEGVLRSGLSTAGTHAALRAALGLGWRLDLQLTETAPEAELVLTQAGEGVAVSGLLPQGLDPAEALKLLGSGSVDAGLAGGGEGESGQWSQGLAALGEVLDLFSTAAGRVGPGEVAIDGVLRPGYPRDLVSERIQKKLPAGWQASLRAEEISPSEGDRRVSLETGTAESFRQGYWLPDVSFPVSAERCRAEADAAMAGGGVPFPEGGAQIAESGLPLVNRLAAIAVRCLNSSTLRLDIGVHTDSVGNDAQNKAVSEARAIALREALVDRGVRANAVSATGYGESRPVATNNTPDGRAQNRRIVLEWSAPAG